MLCAHVGEYLCLFVSAGVGGVNPHVLCVWEGTRGVWIHVGVCELRHEASLLRSIHYRLLLLHQTVGIDFLTVTKLLCLLTHSVFYHIQ